MTGKLPAMDWPDDWGEVRFDSDDPVEPHEVRRFDLAPLRAPTRTREGFLRTEGRLTRAGVFEYQVQTNDGLKTVRELRPPEEVFNKSSMDSLALLPMTLDHPKENLTPETVKDHQVGSVGSPRRVDDHILADLIITDAQAIKVLEGGRKNQLSCGYVATVEPKSGTFKDSAGQTHRFDAVQTVIRYNHLACVDAARAGPTASLRLDSGDGVLHSDGGTDANQRRNDVAKVKDADGKEHEVPDAVAKMIADLKGKLDEFGSDKDKEKDDKAKKDAVIVELSDALKEATSKLDEVQGRLDALEATKQEKQDEAPDAVQVEIEARLDALEKVQAMTGERLDGGSKLTVRQIQETGIAKKFPKLELEGKSDEYIQAVFDTALETRVDTTAKLREAAAGEKDKHDEDPIEAARKRAHERLTTAWQPKGAKA